MSGRTAYVCSGCGFHSVKWLGRCPSCGAWSSLEERAGEPAAPAGRRTTAVPLARVPATDAERVPTGIGELDRVLGGGLVAGATVLLGGEPGVGKSTLLLQAVAELARRGRPVLYASAEESAAQLRLRAERLGVASDDVWIAADTDVDALIAEARALAPALAVVDSIQAVRCTDVASVAGSVTQVRESAARWIEYAKGSGTPVVLVGHVTKDGAIAGPRALEHAVDAVLQFEGDRHHAHRLLRAGKNRFGRAHELGVFRMGDAGLEQVEDPGHLFLGERTAPVPGSVALAAIEGTRPLLVEIQALVGEPVAGSPRRAALGVDAGRVAMVLAVLERRAALRVGDREVFVNVAGGLDVDELAADLAVAVAVASSLAGVAVPLDCFVAGEIGLTGEVRAVSRLDVRLREAARLGFTAACVPAGVASSALRVHPVRTVDEALGLLLR